MALPAAASGDHGVTTKETDVSVASTMTNRQADLDFNYLCKLPAELRNRIIELYVRRSSPLHMQISIPGAVQYESEEYCEPSLALVNRQLRKETLPRFYSLNKFWGGNLAGHTYYPWESARKWLDCKIDVPEISYMQAFKATLCDVHTETLLTIHAPRGTQASYNLNFHEGEENAMKTDERDICAMAPMNSNMRAELQQVCEKVGIEGFAAADYLSAVEICIAATPKDNCLELLAAR